MNTLGLRRPVHSFGLGVLAGDTVDLLPGVEIVLSQRLSQFDAARRGDSFRLGERYQTLILSAHVDVSLLERGDVFVVEQRGQAFEFADSSTALMRYGDDFVLDDRGQVMLLADRAAELLLQSRGVEWVIKPRGKLN